MMAKKVLKWLVMVLLVVVILKTFSTLPHHHNHHQISMNLKMEIIVDLIKLFNRKSYNKSIIHIHKNSISFQPL